MNLEKSIIFSMITIVIAVVLFGGATIIADRQALAFLDGHGHGHGGAYGFYGPCIIKGFSYTWCLNRF
jgi:hypothetical protein